MFQAQNRETKNSTWKLQDHYDDERVKIVFHNIAQNLQVQDRFFGLRYRRSQTTSVVLRSVYWLKSENLACEL